MAEPQFKAEAGSSVQPSLGSAVYVRGSYAEMAFGLCFLKFESI